MRRLKYLKTNWTSLFNPEQYQGWSRTRRYFEGWYFKVLSADTQSAFAFIPGIAMDLAGRQHAFIQVLDGKKQTSVYHIFPVDSFVPKSGSFEVTIADNYFSEKRIRLNLPEARGELHFSGNVPWPKPWYAPGIMGPYAFVPFMECYHGIVSMDHRIKGSLEIENTHIPFDGGRGYIEKDWGRSFPSAYTWMQTNHFSEPGISFKASVANIPWLRSSFVGFIAGLWLKDRLIRFTTYNKTRLTRCVITKEQIELIFENKKYQLEVTAHRDQAVALASPILGLMDGRIEESMSAHIDLRLFDTKARKTIFRDTGRHAALEVAGKIEEIMTAN